MVFAPVEKWCSVVGIRDIFLDADATLLEYSIRTGASAPHEASRLSFPEYSKNLWALSAWLNLTALLVFRRKALRVHVRELGAVTSYQSRYRIKFNVVTN